MKKLILLLLLLFGLVFESAFAQPRTEIETKGFRVAPAASIDYSTPQKYGGTVNFTFGVQKNTNFIEENDTIYKTWYEVRGLNVEAGLFRGGYRFGLYYADLGSSMVGTAGLRLGAVYMNNNSFSIVSKGEELVGLEAEFYAFYKFKVGVLKEINSNKVIPSLGFAITLGPGFKTN